MLSSPGRSIALRRILSLARQDAGMEVGYLAEFRDAGQFIRMVDRTDDTRVLIAEGDTMPLADSYCGRVVAGTLSTTISDTRANPITRELAFTEEANVGSYVGVPVSLPDGSLYGTLCCVSAGPTAVTERNARFAHGLAELIGSELGRDDVSREDDRLGHELLNHALEGNAIQAVFQPVVELRTGRVTAAEALTRFAARDPDFWFDLARRDGRTSDLEIRAAQVAAAAAEAIPAQVVLSLNFSAETLVNPALLEILSGLQPRRIGIELTEHTVVEDYQLLRPRLRRLREAGVLFAVDDAGAGFASLRHILEIEPDTIKIDISIIRQVDGSRSKRALVVSLVGFSEAIGAMVVAEGVETEAELACLIDLGVHYGQGYLLGRPGLATSIPASIQGIQMGANTLRRSSSEPIVSVL